MADTTVLTREVEDFVRAHLAEQHGQAFGKRFLVLRTGGKHEFDAVSEDGSIIASIKAHSGRTSGGNIPSGKIFACIAELYYLSLANAPTRLLVLTNPQFFEIFKRKMREAVVDGVAIEHIPLSAELQNKVDLVVEKASQEMSHAREVAEAEVETEIT